MNSKAKELEKVKFPGETFVEIDQVNVGFEEAQNAASEHATEFDSNAMLMGWYDSKNQRESPSEMCEAEETEPGWVTYAKSRGGNFTVNVNNGEYIFIYRTQEQS
jgi:hypothetical protein